MRSRSARRRARRRRRPDPLFVVGPYGPIPVRPGTADALTLAQTVAACPHWTAATLAGLYRWITATLDGVAAGRFTLAEVVDAAVWQANADPPQRVDDLSVPFAVRSGGADV